MKGKYIAFFDSGVGGLSLLVACAERYPRERYLYFGDNANAPYGNRGAAEIRRLTQRAFERLARYPVAAAVIACNTVTAECVDFLREKYAFPIVGVEPAVRPACAFARGGRVLLLATRATLESARVRRLIAECSARAAVYAHCPRDLAGEIEQNILTPEKIDLSRHLPAGKFDAAVLGCTHYVLLRGQIGKALGCPVFDGVSATVDHIAQVANICSKNCKKGRKKAVFFVGASKNINKRVFFALKKANKRS